jgi:uncharacterized protein (DUF362 family)
MKATRTTRRNFLGKSIVTGIGIAAGLRAASFGGAARAATDIARVAITKGDDRADNAFRALQMFKKQIAAAIGNKRVIIKPNFVYYSTLLSCTHVSFAEGVLEFLKSIGKRDVAMAESSATGSTMAGYDLNGYWDLAKKYPVKLMDLNQEGFAYAQIWQYGDINNTTQKTIRISRVYLNPNDFIISCAPMKTHNTAVVTLSLKNVAMSAPVVDVGNAWSQTGGRGDKAWMHGAGGSAPGDYQALNDNVYRMAKVYGIHPHLSVIDGYQGMQGDGPVSGYAVNPPQKLAVASLDWLAADRVALELMGSNNYILLNTMPYPACLNYCWQAGLGEWDISKIQVIGEPIAGNVFNYAPSPSLSSQLNLRTTPRE